MLFYIDQSVAQAISDFDNNRLDIVSAVENIAQSRRQGKHLVFGERNTIGLLKENLSISVVARSVYAKLYNQLPQDKAYFDEMLWHVHVVDEIDTLEMTNANGKFVIKMSARYLVNFSLLDQTIILSENQVDVELYEYITKSYLHWANIGHTVLRFEPRGGGGHTTAREYLSIQKRGERLCLCILDSDYRYEHGEFGQTARAVEKVDEIHKPLCMFLPLAVREIENLVPTSIYLEISNGNPERMKAVETLSKIDASTSPQARKFLDLKKGLRLLELLKVGKSSPHYIYWDKVINECELMPICAGESCSSGKENCTCIIFYGFGDSIIAEIIKFFEREHLSTVVSLVDEATMLDWANLGRIILAWCCGSSQMSAT